MKKFLLILASLLLVSCGPTFRSQAPTAVPLPVARTESTPWRVDPEIAALYGEPPIAGRLPTEMRWSPDGKRVAYLRLGTGKRGRLKQELWIYDLPRDLETPLFAEADMSVSGYTWCGSSCLVLAADGELYQMNLDGEQRKRLTRTQGRESSPVGSPDGSKVAFVRSHNLFVIDLTTGEERQITRRGTREQTFGEVTWLYQEELDTEEGIGWSPDGEKLWFFATDLSQVPFRVILQEDGSARSMAYPRAGEPNPVVRVGFVALTDTDAGVRYLEAVYEKESYIPRVQWHPDGQHLLVTRLDRLQTTQELFLCELDSVTCERVLEERDPRYVDLLAEPVFINDGKEMLRLSEQGGFAHIFRSELNGASAQELTFGAFEVTEINAVDEKSGHVIFTANVESPISYGLYRAPLAGGEIEKLPLERGTHEVVFSPDLTRYLDTHSALDRPPRCDIRNLGNGSAVPLGSADRGTYKSPEVFTKTFPLQTSDGRTLMAMLTSPKVIAQDVKYPVLVIVYGGPHVQLVKDAFHPLYQPWRDLLASRGVLVFSVDGRGSAGRGREHEASIRLQLGKAELQDQLQGIAYLRTLPMVDPSRIGVFGWSYGGTMALNMLLRTDKVFKMGIAVAPVTDWRFYDSAYTERYMQRPVDNPEGYRAASLIGEARRLSVPLLLVHGIADENVHFVHSQKMFDALVDAGAQFETLFYPGKSHRIDGARTRAHLFTAMTRFVEDAL